jgi:chromosome segregation ATPase
LLLSSDNYERFLRNVEEQINNADKEMKENAEKTLKIIADNYRRLVSERLAAELGLIDDSLATGNDVAARHHRVLADVYRSMLDSWPAAQAA